MRARLMPFVALAAFGLAGCQTLRSAVDDIVGPDLRSEMTDSDVDVAVATMQAALETASDGVQTPWLNPETGNGGNFTPTHTYQTDDGLYCREFREALTVGGRNAVYEDQACRTEDGVWIPVDS